MTISKANIKLWSTIGSRATFGMAALELAKSVDELLILTADTSTSAGLDRFKKTYPEKFLDVGIAEQNMIGIAAGLASEGANVFTATFAPFQTMRCCEQIKVNLGYMRHKVTLVGLASGVVLGPLGYTHCSIEEVAVMRAIPGMTVVSPADCLETYKVAIAAAEHHQSIYIRLTGGAGAAMVYQDDYDFKIGRAVTLREGADVTIFAAGTMVAVALTAADLLGQKGLSVGVINMHTIKPLDHEAVERACRKSRLIVSMEEHSVVGGLGGAIAEFKTTLADAPPQLILGLPDNHGKAAEYTELLARAGLTPQAVAARIESRVAAAA